jgi:CP family cyanate transporter-like MFS transporter
VEWRLALAAWMIPALAAALVWGPLALRGRNRQHEGPPVMTVSPVHTQTQPDTETRDGDEEEGSLLRSPLAWCVMIFMGMTSLMFYTLTSWLPEIMHDQGATPVTAGTMNSVVIIIGIPLGSVVPVVAARLRDQRPLVLGVIVLMAIGLAGLLLAPWEGWVWIAIFGSPRAARSRSPSRSSICAQPLTRSRHGSRAWLSPAAISSPRAAR